MVLLTPAPITPTRAWIVAGAPLQPELFHEDSLNAPTRRACDERLGMAELEQGYASQIHSPRPWFPFGRMQQQLDREQRVRRASRDGVHGGDGVLHGSR
jgi:hypothetical protein